MNNKLVVAEWTTMILGISIMDVQNILSTIMVVISVLIGLINLVMLIKKALRDGKIDKEEKQEILNEVQEIVNEIKENNKDERN